MSLNNSFKLLLLAISLPILASCGKSESQIKNLESSQAYSVLCQNVVGSESSTENYYIGTVEAEITVPVNFTGIGTVQKVYVSEGQFVSRGQTLAVLENSTAKNSMEIAESMEKQAKDAYNRLTKVYKEGSLPEIKYVEMESKLQQAVSGAQIAKKNYNDCILKSPISAMVGTKSIEVGSTATPISSAFTLYKIDNVLIKVSIPENEISKIKKGQIAKIKIQALDNKEFSGDIEEIGVIANTISHSYDIKIRIKNKNNEIKPGMLCNVYLNIGQGSGNLISIPNDAIVSESNKQFVYVVSENNKTVRKQEVKTGNYIGNNIIIENGLNLNEKIVIAGQQKLYNNAPVKVNN